MPSSANSRDIGLGMSRRPSAGVPSGKPALCRFSAHTGCAGWHTGFYEFRLTPNRCYLLPPHRGIRSESESAHHQQMSLPVDERHRSSKDWRKSGKATGSAKR